MHFINYNIIIFISDPVFSTRFTFIVRKKFIHAEKIDLEIMWLHALGLDTNNVHDEIKKNNGIWAPDSGPCERVEQTEICSLPSGSEYYSWGQRNKVKAK